MQNGSTETESPAPHAFAFPLTCWLRSLMLGTEDNQYQCTVFTKTHSLVPCFPLVFGLGSRSPGVPQKWYLYRFFPDFVFEWPWRLWGASVRYFVEWLPIRACLIVLIRVGLWALKEENIGIQRCSYCILSKLEHAAWPHFYGCWSWPPGQCHIGPASSLLRLVLNSSWRTERSLHGCENCERRLWNMGVMQNRRGW